MAQEQNHTWLFEELTAMRREFQEQHQRLRSDFNGRIDQLVAKMEKQSQQLDKISRDVLLLQVEREFEEKAVARRSTWISLIAGGVMSLLLTGIGKWLKWE